MGPMGLCCALGESLTRPKPKSSRTAEFLRCETLHYPALCLAAYAVLDKEPRTRWRGPPYPATQRLACSKIAFEPVAVPSRAGETCTSGRGLPSFISPNSSKRSLLSE